jgi:hypothetical protein
MDVAMPRFSRMIRIGTVMVSALALAGLAACGAGEEPVPEPEDDATTVVDATTPEDQETDAEESSEMPDESPSLDPTWGTEDPKSGAEMTISGTVESGVESGCLVMTYKNEVYGIFGDFDKDVVKPGAKVKLHGHLEPDMMSFCMQGTPFVVEEAESAD